ncbi:MAG: S1 RNA-binding domain-containing protein [Holophagales bacterium]|nr:S1 RNA-binding domain-containing protein [Holophagales bacterium]MYF05130.1 S1 RNA-binding domain-containing protein [Holophagales bacterium]
MTLRLAHAETRAARLRPFLLLTMTETNDQALAQEAAESNAPADQEPAATPEETPPAETEAIEAEAAPAEQASDGAAPEEEQVEPEPEVAAAPEAEEEQAVEEVPLAASALPFAAALEAKNPVEGKVIGWNKGGFHIASDGVTAFCPRSLMELGNRPKPPSHYVNNTYAFHVLEIKEAGRRIVLTRRPAIRSERRQALDGIRAKQECREPVTGKVTSVTEFGAFVDLGGGLGGLVHRTQISRTRNGEPADLVKVGQQVEALVTKVEQKNGKRSARISLSMKALEADPWKETAKGFSAGDEFKGKVVRHCEFGFFVELAPGLDGLVHTSQLPIGKSMSHPAFATGEEIEGWIVEVAPKRRRIALSLREVPASDPWKDLGKQYVEGAEVEGKVEQVSRFGIFVELEPGLTGLLPMSAVKLPEGGLARRTYPPGREIKVVIESIDRKRRRLGLAPPGSQLVGTKTDYKKYRQRQRESSGLNVMAAAFAKLQQPK